MKSAVLAEPLPDLMRSVVRVLRYKTWLAAGILFLCKQLVLYYEQKVRPRPIDAPRGTPAWLNRWFNWPIALAVVLTRSNATKW